VQPHSRLKLSSRTNGPRIAHEGVLTSACNFTLGRDLSLKHKAINLKRRSIQPAATPQVSHGIARRDGSKPRVTEEARLR